VFVVTAVYHPWATANLHTVQCPLCTNVCSSDTGWWSNHQDCYKTYCDDCFRFMFDVCLLDAGLCPAKCHCGHSFTTEDPTVASLLSTNQQSKTHTISSAPVTCRVHRQMTRPIPRPMDEALKVHLPPLQISRQLSHRSHQLYRNVCLA